MKNWLENLKKGLADEETARYLKFLIIPLLVLVFIIIIVAADRTQEGNGEKTMAVVQNGPVGETEEDNTGEETAGIEGAEQEETVYRLKEAGEEITDLMEAYFTARKTCSVSGLAEVFGDSASPEELREEGLRIEEEVKYYQNYSDLACFSAEGPTEDSLVVYTRFNMKFRQADTVAPSLFACLVKKGGDGNWHMMARLTPEEEAYLAEVNESSDVQKMAEKVNAGLRSALESDSNLLAVYNTLMDREDTDGEKD